MGVERERYRRLAVPSQRGDCIEAPALDHAIDQIFRRSVAADERLCGDQGRRPALVKLAARGLESHIFESAASVH